MTRTETVLRLLDEMSCGAALLDDAGAVLMVNACAERILVKHAAQGTTTRSRGWSAQALRGLFGRGFAKTEAGFAIAESEHSALARPLIGHKMPLVEPPERTHSIFLLIDLNDRPAPSIAALRRAFGLTAAEARLAAQLGIGRSLRQIAHAQEVTIVTMRTHLRTVLAKTRTHRQAELVALVNRLMPLP